MTAIPFPVAAAAASTGDELLDMIVDGWWGDLRRALCTEGVEVTANSTVSAADWNATMRRALRDANFGENVPRSVSTKVHMDHANLWEAFLAVRSGVVLADLRAAAVHAVSGPKPSQAVTVLMMASDALVFAGMSLATMIGWILATPPRQSGNDDFWNFDHVQPWVDAGLGRQGWPYAAAGLTVTEAIACLKDGSLPVEQAAVMAALRGLPVPVGTTYST